MAALRKPQPLVENVPSVSLLSARPYGIFPGFSCSSFGRLTSNFETLDATVMSGLLPDIRYQLVTPSAS